MRKALSRRAMRRSDGAVDAVRPCSDGGVEVAAEGGIVLGEPSDGVFEAALHVYARALYVGGGLSVSAAEAHGGGELFGDGLELFTCARRSSAIAEALRFVELILEL